MSMKSCIILITRSQPRKIISAKFQTSNIAKISFHSYGQICSFHFRAQVQEDGEAIAQLCNLPREDNKEWGSKNMASTREKVPYRTLFDLKGAVI